MNLIDRDALIKEIRENGEIMIFFHDSQRDRDNEKKEFAIDMLLDAPIVDTLQHGHWDDVDKFFGTIRGRCSKCKKFAGLWSVNVPYRYCPYCGARMDEEEEYAN